MAMIFGTLAAVATTTFFVTKNIYNDEHEKIRAHINNQLIIKQERDKSEEYSQWVIIIILGITIALAVAYVALKCTITAIFIRPRQQIIQPAAAPAPVVAPNPAFEP